VGRVLLPEAFQTLLGRRVPSWSAAFPCRRSKSRAPKDRCSAPTAVYCSQARRPSKKRARSEALLRDARGGAPVFRLRSGSAPAAPSISASDAGSKAIVNLRATKGPPRRRRSATGATAAHPSLRVAPAQSFSCGRVSARLALVAAPWHAAAATVTSPTPAAQTSHHGARRGRLRTVSCS